MNKQNKKYKCQGGILLSVLVLMSMYFVLFEVLTNRYRQQQTLLNQTQKYYQYKILENMSIARLQTEKEEAKAIFSFNIGEVLVEKKEQQIHLEIILSTGGKETAHYPEKTLLDKKNSDK